MLAVVLRAVFSVTWFSRHVRGTPRNGHRLVPDRVSRGRFGKVLMD
jgi:hypothetical protein